MRAPNSKHLSRFAVAPRGSVGTRPPCYRYEQSGELFGLMRVRSLNMNDAHIYCTEEQFADEFRAVNDMYLKYFKIFGLEKYQMRFSTHAAEGLGKKYVNEPELWKKTEDMVRKVLIESGINYVEVANEAAFYGPKIDVQVWRCLRTATTSAANSPSPPTRWTSPCPLVAVRKDFGLTYRDKDNANMVRVDADFSATPFKAKISNAEQLRVHTMLVIGGRDLEAGAVSVRLHHGGPQGAKPKAEVVADILAAIKERRA